MNTSNWMKRFAAIGGSALVGLIFATGANAALETVTAEVEFAVPVSIAPINQLQFGVLDVGLLSTESITIAPDSTVTGDIARIAGGVQVAADLLITATAGATVSILVDNVIEAGTGYTLGTFMCNYDGAGSDTACDGAGYTDSAPGATATLLIGATLTGTVAGAVVGVFDGSFDVTVLYQ